MDESTAAVSGGEQWRSKVGSVLGAEAARDGWRARQKPTRRRIGDAPCTDLIGNVHSHIPS
jgi:hypothetical protein